METDPDGTQILMQLFILVLLTLVNAFFGRSRDGSCSLSIRTESRCWLRKEIKRRYSFNLFLGILQSSCRRYRWQSHVRDFSQVHRLQPEYRKY